MKRDMTHGEAFREAQRALESVTIDDLKQEDAEWVEEAYMKLDTLTGKYE